MSASAAASAGRVLIVYFRTIGRRLADFLAPQWLRIGGYWYPRGGIPIDVFWQTGPLPGDVWIPDQGVPPYRGRG